MQKSDEAQDGEFLIQVKVPKRFQKDFLSRNLQ